jgi:hypothetical protein
VQSEYLSVFARVLAVRRERDLHLLEVDIPEALQMSDAFASRRVFKSAVTGRNLIRELLQLMLALEASSRVSPRRAPAAFCSVRAPSEGQFTAITRTRDLCRVIVPGEGQLKARVRAGGQLTDLFPRERPFRALVPKVLTVFFQAGTEGTD